MKEIEKKYSNKDITVTWKPENCSHSTLCWKSLTGLPEVFNPKAKPWINLEGAATEKIIEQIKKCPSGALSFEYNNAPKAEILPIDEEILVEAKATGPIVVHGNLNVKLANGETIKKSRLTSFCGCGASANKPFCDGSHKNLNTER
jgi:uncharacterized Fe-S cluster protein YjdI